MSEPLTAAQLAVELSLPPVTVRLWAHRRLLVPVGRDRHGRPVYSLADALGVERATRRKPRMRRQLALTLAVCNTGQQGTTMRSPTSTVRMPVGVSCFGGVAVPNDVLAYLCRISGEVYLPSGEHVEIETRLLPDGTLVSEMHPVREREAC